jgi:hypothetical protein
MTFTFHSLLCGGFQWWQIEGGFEVHAPVRVPEGIHDATVPGVGGEEKRTGEEELGGRVGGADGEKEAGKRDREEVHKDEGGEEEQNDDDEDDEDDEEQKDKADEEIEAKYEGYLHFNEVNFPLNFVLKFSPSFPLSHSPLFCLSVFCFVLRCLLDRLPLLQIRRRGGRFACKFRDGIVQHGNKEYVFTKGSGNFTW